jgi:hypothetical protein
MKVYQRLSVLINAYHRCIETNNDYARIHLENIKEIQDNILPRGSGIDYGSAIDIDRSTDSKMVIHSTYHVMNEGYYTRIIDYTVNVKASLALEMYLRITGNFGDDSDIKEALYEIYQCALTEEI